jgi:hypothetical protein
MSSIGKNDAQGKKTNGTVQVGDDRSRESNKVSGDEVDEEVEEQQSEGEAQISSFGGGLQRSGTDDKVSSQAGEEQIWDEKEAKAELKHKEDMEKMR